MRILNIGEGWTFCWTLFVSALTLSIPLESLSQTKRNLSTQDVPHCTRVGRRTPPIWVTVTGFDTRRDQDYKNYQNYTQGLLGPEGREPMVVPKRSLVRLSPEYASFVETRGDLETNAEKWIPVKVVSTPPTNTELAKAVSARVASVAEPKFMDFATPGTEGRIRIGDLERVENQKDYLFIVKRDSPLFRALHDPLNPNAAATEVFALELFRSEGLYQVNHCCSEDKKTCVDFPIFRAVGAKGKQGRDILVHSRCEDCWLSSLVPMQSDFVKPIQGILSHPDLGLSPRSPTAKLRSIEHLNFVDARGLVQIPVKHIPNDNTGQLGPYNSYRYMPGSRPLRKGNPEIYLRPESACGFIQVLKTWDEKFCPRGQPQCRIEFGDASHAADKKFNSHDDHDNGDCIDIRPMSLGATGPSGGRSFGGDFNRPAFTSLLKLFQQLGAERCFIADQQIAKEFPECSYRADHNRHLHICFPRFKVNARGEAVPNLKLQNACQQGVK